MGSDRNPSLAGWWLTAALLLLPPLVQGGTPRLPAFAVNLGILSLVVFWAGTWARAPRRELRLNALDALLGFLVFWSLFSTLFAPYYHPAEAASLAIACYVALYAYLSFNPSFAGLSLALGAVRAQAGFQSLLVLGEAIGFGAGPPRGDVLQPEFPRRLPRRRAAARRRRPDLPRARRRPPPAAHRARRRRRGAAPRGAADHRLARRRPRAGRRAAAPARAALLESRRRGALGGVRRAAGDPQPAAPAAAVAPADRQFRLHPARDLEERLSMMLDHPWVGIGLGQYEYVSTRYAFPIETHWAKYTRVAENAHSEYLQAGAELGVPGLLVALGVVALLAHAAVRAPARAAARLVGAGRDAAGRRRRRSRSRPRSISPCTRRPRRCCSCCWPPGCASTASPARSAPSPSASAPSTPWPRVWSLSCSPSPRRARSSASGTTSAASAPRATCCRRSGRSRRRRARELPLEESTRLIGLAARIDFTNAPYRRALGSQYFQSFLRGEGGTAALQAGALSPQLRRRAQPEPVPVRGEPRPGDDLARPAGAAGPRAARGGARPLPPRRRAGAVPAPGLDRDRAARRRTGGRSPRPRRPSAAPWRIEEYFLRGWFNLGTFYARHGQARRGAGGVRPRRRARRESPVARADHEARRSSCLRSSRLFSTMN